MSEFSLECSLCARTSRALPRASVCPECGKPLLVRYTIPPAFDARRAWERRGGSMWSFRERLPLRSDESPVSLGEGNTPLLTLERLGADLGIRLLVKDEGRNPTGSFKDRGLSAAVTRTVRDGVSELVIPSAGNAGASLAAYAARAGVTAHVFIPDDTPEGVERRCRGFGARVTRIPGVITDCGRAAAEHAADSGAFELSTLREPYRIEGKKTMMMEIVRDLGWEAPDAIVYPTGGGTGLIGSWKALQELQALDAVESSTRLYAVQAEGCAPIVRAWEAGWSEVPPWESPHTEAWGLRVPRVLGDRLILEALSASGGGAVAIPDAAMIRDARALGREGISASIEGGATLAAVRQLRERDELREGERVVLFNTGHMLTY